MNIRCLSHLNLIHPKRIPIPASSSCASQTRSVKLRLFQLSTRRQSPSRYYYHSIVSLAPKSSSGLRQVPFPWHQTLVRRNMATATKIHLTTHDSGVMNAGVREDTAKLVSQVLQDDMGTHHIFFNQEGFHNHTVHHALTIYALGAQPDVIREAYDRDQSYQRPAQPPDDDIVNALYDRAKFKEHLGKEANYSNFLTFFQQEIQQKGVADVLNEYLFAEDERADDMLGRLYSGLLHPFIHLGFGLEFNQPAIVAEGMAEAAVHDNWLGPRFLLPVEKAAGGIGKSGTKTLLQILQEAAADEKLAQSAHWSDANKIRDGILQRAPEEMIKYASQFRVSPNQLEEKVAELVNFVVYFTAAAQRPDKEVKMDFYLMHCVTSSIFLSTIINLPYLDQPTKARVVEWMGRTDLAFFISRSTPKLNIEEITNYPIKNTWNEIFAKGIRHPEDDGHLPKMLRAVAHGEAICRPYENEAQQRGLMITGDMWLKIGNMVNDSVFNDHVLRQNGSMWVRSTGFDQAWRSFGDRAHL